MHRAKTILHRKLRNDLQNDTLPDDERAKLYQQFLSRLLHTKDKIHEQPIIKQELEKKNTRKRQAETPKPTRKSKRKSKKVIKWEEWYTCIIKQANRVRTAVYDSLYGIAGFLRKNLMNGYLVRIRTRYINLFVENF